MRHPITDKSLQRFATGASSREESRSIVAHLLHGCAACAAHLRSVFRPEVPAGAYDAVLDRLAVQHEPTARAGVLPFPPRPAAAPVVVQSRRARR
jgi:hypothetical protein